LVLPEVVGCDQVERDERFRIVATQILGILVG
jgi:hypothetical protein